MKKTALLSHAFLAVIMASFFTPLDAAQAKQAVSAASSKAPAPTPSPSSESGEVAATPADQPPSGIEISTQTTPPPPAPPPPPPPHPAATADQSDTGFLGGVMKFFGEKKSTPTASSPNVTSAGPVAPPVPAGGQANPPQSAVPVSFSGQNISEKDVDQKSLEIAKKLVKSFDMEGQLQGPMMGMAMSLLPIVSQENPGQMDKINKITTAVVNKIASDHLADAEKDQAITYAQLFTASELEQIKSFYESDAGKKLIKSNGELMRRAVMYSQNLAMSTSQETREAVIKELKKNDLKIPKSLGGD